MRVVRLFDRVLTWLVTAVLVVSFGVMLALAAGQVLLRQVFHTSLAWGDLAARHLVIWVGFFGAFLASRREQHFHIGFLSRLAGPRSRPWLSAVSALFAALVCLALAEAGRTFVVVGLDPQAVLVLGIRQASVALIVPVGFLLTGVQFVLRAIQSVGEAVAGGRAGPS